jgi:hypothetical protein
MSPNFVCWLPLTYVIYLQIFYDSLQSAVEEFPVMGENILLQEVMINMSKVIVQVVTSGITEVLELLS